MHVCGTVRVHTSLCMVFAFYLNPFNEENKPPSLNVYIIPFSSAIQNLLECWPVLMLSSIRRQTDGSDREFSVVSHSIWFKVKRKTSEPSHIEHFLCRLCGSDTAGGSSCWFRSLSLSTRFFVDFSFLCTFFFVSSLLLFFLALNSFVASSFLRRIFGGIEVRWTGSGATWKTLAQYVEYMHIMNDPGFGWLSYSPRDFASKGSKTRHETWIYWALFFGHEYSVCYIVYLRLLGYGCDLGTNIWVYVCVRALCARHRPRRSQTTYNYGVH